MYNTLGKRIIDLVLSVVGFLILSPFFIIVFLLLLIANRSNPLFFQKRPGKSEVPFYLIKFKTMSDAKDSEGNLLPDDQRLTTVGAFVRKTSLDEIPQLINVIKGDMSLIGPRPLLMEYLPLYSDFQKRRHEVKPGITGWAQINGRNSISWERKFELDIYYVDHISLKLDVLILAKTILKVFKSEGISAEGHVTVEKFTGNK
ncbi:sugar transferase [Mongoliitalea lutea]|nr:sugar transferase [Mongoliitalea lutea]